MDPLFFYFDISWSCHYQEVDAAKFLIVLTKKEEERFVIVTDRTC